MIHVGDRLPKRGNGFSRVFGCLLMRLFGWKIEGQLPNLSKCVAVIAPHTSNWDFYFALAAIFALGLRVGWIGKHTLFRWPFGPFMRWLGGAPVRRETSAGRVAEIAELMRTRDRFILGLSPEGTRKRVGRWKTGFYHVARAAAVPIVLAYFDYGRKVVGIGPTFETTGDVERDLTAIRTFYEDKQARHPALF